MANLPEKNITTVDKITSIPSNANLYINANGEFRQATVDDVLKSSPVITDSITNQFKNASGSPILLTDSANGVAIDFNAKGRSTQKQYSGKNFLKCSLTTAITQNGITFTPVYDGKNLLYINVNGTATDNAYTTIASNVTIPSGTYILNGCPSGGGESTYRMYTNSLNYFDYGNGATFTLNAEYTFANLVIYVFKGQTVNNLKFYPMIRKAEVTDGTYEPYVGGTASPNPDYKQTPKSNGDMGYFDGELLQGGYNDSGSYVSQADYVCSKNPMPCNGGDTVKLSYGVTMSTICFCFYDENMTVISRPYTSSVTEYEVTAPTNAKYVNFHINLASITPAQAKPITVTINGKYTLIVDSVGKNLLKNTATSYSKSGVTVTVNNDKTITLNGTCVEGASYVVELATNLKLYAGQYVMTGNPLQGYNYRISLKVNGVYYTDNGNGVTFTVNETTYCEVFFIVNGGTTYNNVTYKPMIRPVGTDDTYEPYKESRKYIPISAPLRGIGEVTDVASLTECEVTRRFTEVVFDGSNDESWNVISTNTNTNLFRVYPPKKAKVSPIICSHFVYYSGSNEDFEHTRLSAETNPVLAMWVNKTRIDTVDEWKAYLQANPITVIYELAEPTTESIEPVDVDTFEGVTHISVSDDAEMEVEYPTSKVAGIASIGWSKGRRAEYDLEQLKAQMLALQTTIVSTV